MWMFDVLEESEQCRPKHVYYFTWPPSTHDPGVVEKLTTDPFSGQTYTSGGVRAFRNEGQHLASAGGGEMLPKEVVDAVTGLTDVAVSLANSEEGKTLLRLAKEPNPSSESAAPRAAQFERQVLRESAVILGGAAGLGIDVRDERDLLGAVARGFPVGTLMALREAGYAGDSIERVVAPRRTLARRRATAKRLTEAESDAAWRMAHCLALATAVLRDKKTAMDWLSRPKSEFGNSRPVDLLATGVGARAVERLLLQLEWGNVA